VFGYNPFKQIYIHTTNAAVKCIYTRLSHTHKMAVFINWENVAASENDNYVN